MTAATAYQVVTFRVADDHFAADILAVERVLRYRQPQALPKLPEWIDGVIEYQGRVVPVIDLRRRFQIDYDATRPTTGGRIIVFAVGDDWIGAVVDAVLEVMTLPEAQISPPPPLFRGLKAEYLRGLVRRDGKLIIFLEVQRLLTTTERIALERALEEVPQGVADGGGRGGANG
jgi:purine-binding chemotaxis protein CheW